MTQKNTGPYLRCLAPLLDALEWRGDEVTLSNSLPYHSNQLEISDFIRLMAHLNFKVDFISSKIRNDQEIITPCLLISDVEKPKVLLKKSGTQYLYFDGVSERFGMLDLPNIKNTFLYFYKDDDTAGNLLIQQENWFFKFLLRFKPLLLKAFVVSLILSFLALLSPLLVMTIYGQISLANVNTNMTFLTIGISILIIAFMGFTFLKSYILNYIGSRMSYIINTEVVRRLVNLPPALISGSTVGSQLARLQDFESIKSFFTGIGFSSILDLPFVIILLIAIYCLGGYIVIVPITSIFLFILMGLVYGPLTKKINSLSSSMGKEKSDFIYESVINLKSISSSGLKKKWVDRFKKLNMNTILSTRDSSILTQTINIISSTIVSIAALLTISLGVIKVIDNEISTGALMAIILILWKVLNPLKSFFSVLAQFDKIKSSIVQIDRFMNLPLEESAVETGNIDKLNKGNITFNQVSFRFSSDVSPSLLGINLKLKAGETLIVYGHSGSGKSTILKLILSMLKAQSGKILIDKMNIKQINPTKLRKSIAYCPQHSQFTHESIRNNLRAVKPKITDMNILEMAKRFDLYDEIKSLKNGLDTIVSKNLEKSINPNFLKKLSLLRTFIKQSDIILIDEISKDLTLASYKKIEKFIISRKDIKTTIITTSSPEHFKLADKVLWLDRGRVKFFGKPSRANELYLSFKNNTKESNEKSQ